MSEESGRDELPEISEEGLASGAAGRPHEDRRGLGFVMEVPVRLSVEIGSARLLVREVLQLAKGSVVELDRMNGDPADIYINDRLIARGEITVVDDRMGVRIVELLGTEGVTTPG